MESKVLDARLAARTLEHGIVDLVHAMTAAGKDVHFMHTLERSDKRKRLIIQGYRSTVAGLSILGIYPAHTVRQVHGCPLQGHDLALTHTSR